MALFIVYVRCTISDSWKITGVVFMKIVMMGGGFIDPVQVFIESSKPKFLKNLIVLSRDRYYINKLRKKIQVLDYSDENEKLTSQGTGHERMLLMAVKQQLADALKKCGDLLFVATCEPAEMAALPLLQEICQENQLGFHVFLVAPFLFQGKKQAEQMKKMISGIGDNYVSVSLYYADELLKIADEQNHETESPTMRNAYDALEKSVVDIARTMSRQIPKLDRWARYTYDFSWQQFSMAVDPLKLILDMWYGIVMIPAFSRSQSESRQRRKMLLPEAVEALILWMPAGWPGL